MSRYYRRVFPRLFQNPAWKQLDSVDKLLALYLLTGPQVNRLGLYPISMALAADLCGIQLGEFRPRLTHVLDRFEWRLDEHAHVVWVPSFLVWNAPETFNQLKNIARDLDDVPRGCVFLPPLLQILDRIGADMPKYQHAHVQAFLVELKARYATAPAVN